MIRIMAFFCLLVCGFIGSTTAEEIPGVHLYFFRRRYINSRQPNPLSSPLQVGIGIPDEQAFFIKRETGFLPNNESVDGTTAIRFSVGPRLSLCTSLRTKTGPLPCWRHFMASGFRKFAPIGQCKDPTLMIDFGGGINYWASPRYGLKTGTPGSCVAYERNDHPLFGYARGNMLWLLVRIQKIPQTDGGAIGSGSQKIPVSEGIFIN